MHSLVTPPIKCILKDGEVYRCLYGRGDDYTPYSFVVFCFNVAFFLQAGQQALDGGFVDAQLFAQTVDGNRWLGLHNAENLRIV